MQVVLVMFSASGERRSFSITKDVTTIGRRENADLRIPLGDVSRKHCRLTVTRDAARIDDLGSSNGTLVNGTRVDSAPLRPGDVLQVGPVQFTVQIDGNPADDEITPPAPPAPSEEIDLLPDAPAPADDSFAAVLEGLPGQTGGKLPVGEDEDWDIISDEPNTGDADQDAAKE